MDTSRQADTMCTSPIRRVAEPIVGVALLAAGLAGLVLPVLPGWLLIIAGIVLIAGSVPALRRTLSAFIVSRPVIHVFRGAAERASMRKLVVGSLMSETARRALDRSSRWVLVHHVVRAATARKRERSRDGEGCRLAR